MLLLLVLSDANKRFLYDVGVYDCDDDDDENVSSNDCNHTLLNATGDHFVKFLSLLWSPFWLESSNL